jgi:putative NADPH-quinone reductase
MSKRILIIQGHPDASVPHYGHALAGAYARAATTAGHEVKYIAVAELEFPLLRSGTDWNNATLPPSLQDAQNAFRWADHVVIFFPLWLGTMPAILKGFLEQVLRPGFALTYTKKGFPQAGLAGKSARVVVTMGMPALWYRWYFRAHGVRGLERSILRFCGIKPVHETLIGMIESKDDAGRKRWLAKLESLGRRAA